MLEGQVGYQLASKQDQSNLNPCCFCSCHHEPSAKVSALHMGIHTPAAQSQSSQGCNRDDICCRYGQRTGSLLVNALFLEFSRLGAGKRTSGMDFHHFSAWLVPITQRLAALGAVGLVRGMQFQSYVLVPISVSRLQILTEEDNALPSKLLFVDPITSHVNQSPNPRCSCSNSEAVTKPSVQPLR